jgi:hypothetical protein
MRTARALRSAHPDFWQHNNMENLDQNPMLLGFWQLYLKQAKRKGMDPRKAASGFVKATSRPTAH